MTGLETILISGASFVVGAVVGVVGFALAFGKQFVLKSACEARYSNCYFRGEKEQADIKKLSGDIKELSKWIRLIAAQMQVSLPESDR
jgi:hypothetical protein